ncbi:sulfotransferase family protein [Azohydromonas caseinilytica]|uniref:Sulfotransferase n=1 Tax=Azohydromonas caseinilytica TaxID=2728836 RepID=A0A848FDQ3_9BURK|nr:sulfotransferase [Azohydromonas caseinilytica]NML17518.1 sulfotransferase [Azohydromonas caseinilytica]
MKSEAGPVFVVGVNGSGTTMLADALGNHPALYMLPRETRVLPSLLHKYGTPQALAGDGLKALAHELGRSKAFWRENGDQPVLIGDDELAGAGHAAEAMARVYLHMARREGKARWGDKTPMYVQHLALLGRAFPDARFVHVLRDGRDCAQSFHRRWSLSPLRSIWRWKKAVATGREQGRQLGARYTEVKYEDLTADPERWMRQLCDFLELPFSAEVLKSRMRYFDPSSAQAGTGAMVRNSERWRTYFNSGTVAQLEAVAGRMLHDAGYRVEQRGDADPAAWRLGCLKWMDWARMTRMHLVNTKRAAGVRAFMLRAREAVAQDRVNRY